MRDQERAGETPAVLKNGHWLSFADRQPNCSEADGEFVIGRDAASRHQQRLALDRGHPARICFAVH